MNELCCIKHCWGSSVNSARVDNSTAEWVIIAIKENYENKNAFQLDVYCPLQWPPGEGGRCNVYPSMHWTGGCVYPSMHWAGGVCLGVVSDGGCLIRGVSWGCLPGGVGGGCLSRGVSAWGVSAQGVFAQGVSATHPPVDRMTEAWENITLPQLRYYWRFTLIHSCCKVSFIVKSWNLREGVNRFSNSK